MFKFSDLSLYYSVDELTDQIPSGLRIALASYYLSRYKKIVLWGSGVNPAPVEFDALYTDMEYVKIKRAASVQEHQELTHYTDMLVREVQLYKYKKALNEAEFAF